MKSENESSSDHPLYAMRKFKIAETLAPHGHEFEVGFLVDNYFQDNGHFHLSSRPGDHAIWVDEASMDRVIEMLQRVREEYHRRKAERKIL